MKILVREKLSEHKYKTPEGYLVCVDAVLARTGKQTYRKNEVFATDDTSEIEVDRTPEEVFSKTTLASFENKPITVEHPDEDVNASNHKDLAVGFVRDVHEGVHEGQRVMLGTLVITDAETIEEIENGEHTDLSCGYDCDIDDTNNPQQKNIRGNHVALCQCGRAGIARIVDSVKDSIHKVEFEVYDYETKKTHKFSFTSANASNVYERLQSDAKKVINNIGDTDIRRMWIDGKEIDPSQVSGSIKYWGTYSMIKKFMGDSVNDATYNVGYVDRHTDQSNYVDVQANSEQEAKEKVRKMYKPYHIFHCRKVKDSMNDEKYRVGQNILYHGKKSKILKIEHDERYGYDLLIVNPDWDGKDKRFENVWVGEDVKTVDCSTNDASDNAYRKVQFILEKNPQFKGKINKQEHDTGEIMIDFADWRNADKFVAECKRSGLRCREGYFGSDTTILVRDSDIKDAKETYNIVWWDTYAKSKGYDRDSWRFIAEIKADSLKEALQKLADKVALAGVGTANAMIVRVATNTKNYQFSGKLSDLLRRNDLGDSNEELDIKDCDYNNVDDSCAKDSLTPVHEQGRDDIVYVMQSNVDKNLYFYIGKTYSMRDGEWTYQKYKMNDMTPDQLKKELEAAGWHRVNKGPYNFIDSIKDSRIIRASQLSVGNIIQATEPSGWIDEGAAKVRKIQKYGRDIDVDVILTDGSSETWSFDLGDKIKIKDSNKKQSDSKTIKIIKAIKKK